MDPVFSATVMVFSPKAIIILSRVLREREERSAVCLDRLPFFFVHACESASPKTIIDP